MTRNNRFLRGMVGVAVLAMAECAGFAALTVALTAPAQAQFWDDRAPSRQRQSRSGGGFFENLFSPNYQRQDDRGGGSGGGAGRDREQAPADYARAPSPRKPDKDAPAPSTSVVVMGDGMADWLAYGLEDAFADTPEVGIVRRAKTHSGLIRYDAKSDLDWWHAARDILNGEKPNYVIMMLGVGDRENIRERDVAKEAEKKKEEAAKSAPTNLAPDAQNNPAPADKTAQNKDAEDAEAAPIVAPEPAAAPGKKLNGVIEFRSEPWEKIYSRRIDDTVAALKSKGVPVFWVGLPSIRGAKSTADAVYLNDLYRGRAEKAGAIYIDVWDGFVDEGGKYTNYGPDYEGQMRRLRSGDGVYFTKYGARKLAHYVERELRRYMSNRALQVSLPTGPAGPAPADGTPAARPLAGPVVPLTMTTANSDQLLGGGGQALARGDAIATDVLVKGGAVAPPPGRADNFYLTPDGVPPVKPPVVATAPLVTPIAAAPKPAAGAAPSPAQLASQPPVAVAPAPVKPAPEPVVAQPASVKPEPAAPAVANTEPAAETPEPTSIVNPEPVTAAEKTPAETERAAKPASRKSTAERKPVERREQKPRREVENRPRPPAGVGQQRAQQPPPRRSGGGGLFDSNGPFGWIR